MAVPPFCPMQAPLYTARLENTSSMGGLEPCLILGLALQVLYQIASSPPGIHSEVQEASQAQIGCVWGRERMGPHFPTPVQSHLSRKTGYSWSDSIDTW